MTATATKPRPAKNTTKKPPAAGNNVEALALDRLVKHLAGHPAAVATLTAPNFAPLTATEQLRVSWQNRLELADPSSGTIFADPRGIVITTREASGRGAARRDVVAAIIPWQELAGRLRDRLLPPGATSTTTPAGIARHDPDARPLDKPAAAPAQPTAPPVELRAVLLAAISPSRQQARKEFDESELAALAESMQASGLLQPVTVQEHKPGRFELIAGERRYRAAKLLGWTTIQALIRAKTSDATSAALGLIENLQRADLAPMEEAQGLAAYLAETGHTQAQAAAAIGRSQPYIANALRLLDLPDPWKQWVITREMSPSHARAVAPWLNRPKLAKELAQDWRTDCERCDHESPPLSTWKDTIDRAVRHATKPLWTNHYNYAANQSFEIEIVPTDEQRSALDLIELPDFDGTPETRAFNLKLAEKLFTAAEQQAVAAAKNKKAKKSAGHQAAELTPAQQRIQTQQKAKDRARKFADGLARWLLGWKSYLLAEDLSAHKFSDTAPAVLTILARQTVGHDGYTEQSRRRDVYKDTLRPDELTDIPAGPNSASLATAYCVAQLWTAKDGPRGLVAPELLEHLIEARGIDLAAAWQREYAGPETFKLWDLFVTSELAEYAQHAGLKDLPSKKSELIDALDTEAAYRLPIGKPCLPMPAALAALLTQPAGKRKKGRK